MGALPELPGYEFVSQIGRGAGATISLAYEQDTRRPVAIKHVVCRSAEDQRFIAQAETEYRVATQVDHPHLRKYYDIVRVRRWLKTRELFLIMEYVDGRRMEDHPPELLDDMISIFIKVAQGLHAMHLAGYAHADIKPNNILLGRNGALKIIDFGQSCPLGHRKTRLQGTPDYMAPEQVARGKIDHRTDIFNLGATMYWVATGKWFKTMFSTAPAASKKIEIESRRGSQPPHELIPDIPLSLSKLIMECCERSPEMRPLDMRKVASRLEVVQHLIAHRSQPTGQRQATGS